ncbi:hypothetical protein FQA39_LY16015 [Lamprigera yunnana]|nr:hypothetical protein FQA39_LY16015 [Lamprigera yunnana]
MYFTWIDYLVFVGLLTISLLIGIYYGCFGTKQNTIEEYLHGGRKLKYFPVGMSLVASHLSGITVLGIPAEIYLYGTQYMVCPITITLLMISLLYVFLPVYYNLQLSSSFEYLNVRFGNSTRSLASFLYIISTLLYVPIVIYGPSLALNQVTGISVHVISPLICILCIFYTTLGGLKAVVISDTIQLSITILTMFAVFGIGTYLCGGFTAIWDKAESRDRIEFFNMSLDPTVRQTFWAIVVGMGTTYIGNLAINPSSIQRFLSLPSFDAAKKSVLVFGFGTMITKLMGAFIGLILFAKYSDCDPFSTGAIKRVDQLVPYFMMDAIGNLKGLSGLFVAGVFGTALSTMSTNINTLSLTFYEDFLKSRLPSTLSKKKVTYIIKAIVVISGTISLCFIFLIEKLGGVLQIALSVHGLTVGPLVGMTVLGMMFPCANSKGALIGGVCSTVLSGILVVGAQIYLLQGRIKPPYLSLSIAGCDLNTTILTTLENTPEPPPAIFLVSFYYYALIGASIVVIVGLVASWVTRSENDAEVSRKLLTPCIYWLLPKTAENEHELDVHDKLTQDVDFEKDETISRGLLVKDTNLS